MGGVITLSTGAKVGENTLSRPYGFSDLYVAQQR
jgi:hypothetical protein